MRTHNLFKRALGLLLLSLSPLRADFTNQPEETLPGFKSQEVYDFHGIDNVNLYSGDLHLAIPLGPEYPLSSGVKWQLTAHYSSKLWHMWLATCNIQNESCPGQPEYAQRAHVAGYSTIGVGWTLELGSIRPTPGGNGATYKAPDGSVHFRMEDGFGLRSLPDGAVIDANANLRLDPPPVNGSWVVRQADGTVHYFEHSFSIPGPSSSFDFSDEDRDNPLTYQPLRYGLSRIVDRFGNTVLQVTYRADFPWKVASIQLSNPARTINLNWGTWTQPGADVFNVLNSIEFPAVGGGTPLTTSFTYRADGTVNRSAFDGGGTSYACPSPGPLSTKLPFLNAITRFSRAYSFNYELADAARSAVLNRLTLPTGGVISYGYSTYTVGSTGRTDSSPELKTGSCFVPGSGLSGPGPSRPSEDPGGGCSDWNHRLQFLDTSPAVISRTETGLAGELPGNPPPAVQVMTSYSRANWGSPENPGSMIIDPFKVVRIVFVQRADGNGGPLTTKHVFSASYSGGAELSRRTYTNCDGSEGPGQPVRSFVQCFRLFDPNPDASVCGVMESTTLIHDVASLADLAPSRKETWYGANPIPNKAGLTEGCSNSTTSVPCWQDAYAGYNTTALEYATVTRSSNNAFLVSPQNLTRTTTTAWAPVSVAGGTWLPKLYSSTSVTDSPCAYTPCTATTIYSFDSSNGFLNYSRSTDGTYGTMTHSWERNLGAADVFEREDPWKETLSASFDSTSYVNTRTFKSGLTKSLQRTTPSGIAWFTFDATRDASTGVITATRDPNGLTTSYGYDSLVRLTSATSPGELSATYCYLDWNTTAEMSTVFVKKGGVLCSPDDGAPPTAGSGPFEAYQYDGMGRVKRHMRRLPNPLSSGSYFAFREIRYNAAGLKAFESEWTPCGLSPNGYSARSCYSMFASQGTTYSNFDFLGRPRTIQLADGNIIARNFNDPNGIPNSDFTELTTTTVSGAAVTGGVRKNILGHALIVAEPGPPPLGPISGYHFNVLDKVASVDVGNAGQQLRTFTYDTLGLLRSETHPEKGTTNYTNPAAYDALGNVKKKTEGGHTYDYQYDAMGRLTSVTADSATYALKSYDGNGYAGGTYPLGRITQQSAFHPLSFSNVQVVRNYAYSDTAGRLSWRGLSTYKDASPIFIATESFTYNTLGLLATHNHARTSGSWPTTTTYVSGFPTSLDANSSTYISNATYNPAGGLATYLSGNGVTTTISQASHLMPRPLQISTSGASQNFLSGNYGYDGVGNVMSIGADSYSYDGRSRLTNATYAASGSQFDSFQYDIFGNLYRRDYEGGYQDLTTSLTTNRLTGSTYDLLGNLWDNGSDHHTYDNLSRQIQYTGSGANERYFYDASGERVARVLYASSLPQQSTQERFYNLTPCRILDTRNPNGTYGGPSLAGQGSRSFPVSGICGIPSNAKSLALNVTTVDGGTTANVRLFPSGLSYQPLGTANAYKAGYPRANQTFGSIDGPTAGSFTLFNDAPAGYPVHVIVDVQGYFAPGPGAPPQSGDSWFFTLRDLGNHPSVEYRYDTATGQPTLLKDHVWFGNQLVADYTWQGQPNGLVYFTNDHLGSPRLMTGGTTPVTLATYKYRAFGLNLSTTLPGQGPDFAGMERDVASSDLYDHARYVGGKLSRFKGADQLGGHAEDPQSWNRYTYARNNPLKYVDPDGKSNLTAAEYARAALEAAGKTADDIAFAAARPMLGLATGILNNSGTEFAGGMADLAFQGGLSGLGGFWLSKFAAPELSLLGRNPEAPVVVNRALRNTVDALFKPTDEVAGGTAGAILQEARTGVPVGNKGFHILKGIERSKNLERVLQEQNLSGADRKVAEQLKKELDEAIRVYRTTANAVNQ